MEASHGIPPAVYLFPTYLLPIVPTEYTADPAPSAGRLRVDMDPDIEGQVYLDGYYVGRQADLSHALEVTSGQHAIEIRADGYQVLQDDIAVGTRDVP